MKKTVLVFLCTLILLGLFSGIAGAEQPIRVVIDGESVSLYVNPVISEGRTLVPVREVVESMGGDIEWNGANKTVTIVRGNTNIVLVIDSRLAKVNDRDIILDVPATIYNGRTLIPVRFVSENLDAEVGWEAVSRTVTIKTPVNIDDEAFKILVEVSQKSKDIKQANMDIEGDIRLSGKGPDGPENVKLSLIGNLKADNEAPAFALNGKFTIHQGVVSEDLNLEMVFKDYAFYLKDPFTGTWQVEEMAEEDAEVFEQLMQQNNSLNIDYTALFEIAKEIGAIRNLSFAGEKTINGIDTKGVYLELNGLKLKRLLQTALSNGYDETVNDMIEEAMEVVSVNKIKYTYWVADDDMYYGYDCEVRVKANQGEKVSDEQIVFELNTEMTLSDINREQDITVPELEESGDIAGTGSYVNY